MTKALIQDPSIDLFAAHFSKGESSLCQDGSSSHKRTKEFAILIPAGISEKRRVSYLLVSGLNRHYFVSQLRFFLA